MDGRAYRRRFGMSLAESLSNAGAEVLLLDRNRPAMQMANEFATALQGDATQPRVLEEAGFGECDVVIVAIGSNMEASMIANLGLGGTTFGSGCLLDDLIHFVYQGRNDRLLLIGDKAQLPPVGEEESPALSAAQAGRHRLD